MTRAAISDIARIYFGNNLVDVFFPAAPCCVDLLVDRIQPEDLAGVLPALKTNVWVMEPNSMEAITIHLALPEDIDP